MYQQSAIGLHRSVERLDLTKEYETEALMGKMKSRARDREYASSQVVMNAWVHLEEADDESRRIRDAELRD